MESSRLNKMTSIKEKLRLQPPRRGSKKLNFLALKSEIAEALDDGYSARAIWDLLQKENNINMSYGMFSVYVKKFISSGVTPSIEKKIELKNHKSSEDEERKLRRAKLEEVRKRQEEEREKNKFFHPSTPRDINDLI